MAYLQLKDIKKSFGDVDIIKGVDLEIQKGEFIVFVGPSGCGKSTLLRLIAGLEPITSGKLLLDGKDITWAPSGKRDLAMVFQSYALYPHMSVYDNMSFALKLAGVPKDEIKTKVEYAAKTLNLTQYLDRTPKDLSGGQRQRVAIGRAIVRAPKVFLFDEPLSNLDAKLRGHMRAELALLHERLAKTTVYVTHDQVEAMTLADRIVIFDKGRIQQVGTPAEVFNRPATLFVAAFIGMPGMNLLPVRFADRPAGHGTLCGEGFELPAPAWLRERVSSADQALTLGIRPQALHVANGYAPLNVKVDIVEYLGTESQVVGHLASPGGARITATVQGDAHGLLHGPLGLNAHVEDMHLFDTASGQSLRP